MTRLRRQGRNRQIVLTNFHVFEPFHYSLMPAQDEDPSSDAEEDGTEEPADAADVGTVHSVEIVENEVFLEKELSSEIAKFEESMSKGSASSQGEIPAAPGQEEANVQEPPLKQPKLDRCPMSLEDILVLSGMDQWKPMKEEDTECEAIKRVNKLRPYLNSFSTLVRCHEGLLSQAVVTGDLARLPEQCVFEAELGKATHEFHCSAVRQSRHALWCDYTGRLLAAYKAMDTGDEDEHGPVRAIKGITPTSCAGTPEARSCQVLMIRPCMAGGDIGPFRLGS